MIAQVDKQATIVADRQRAAAGTSAEAEAGMEIEEKGESSKGTSSSFARGLQEPPFILLASLKASASIRACMYAWFVCVCVYS